MTVHSNCCVLLHFRLVKMGFKMKSAGFLNNSFPIVNESERAVKAGDVGLTLLKFVGDRLSGFSLLLLVDGFQANAELVSSIPPAFLIGRITISHETEWINNLAATSHGDRHDLILHLETENGPPESAVLHSSASNRSITASPCSLVQPSASVPKSLKSLRKSQDKFVQRQSRYILHIKQVTRITKKKDHFSKVAEIHFQSTIPSTASPYSRVVQKIGCHCFIPVGDEGRSFRPYRAFQTDQVNWFC